MQYTLLKKNLNRPTRSWMQSAGLSRSAISLYPRGCLLPQIMLGTNSMTSMTKPTAEKPNCIFTFYPNSKTKQ